MIEAASSRLLIFYKNDHDGLLEIVNFCFSDDTAYPPALKTCHPQTQMIRRFTNADKILSTAADPGTAVSSWVVQAGPGRYVYAATET